MDPQQRLLLQGVMHALEDAGITLEMVSTHQPAAYPASWCYDYTDLLPADQYMCQGNSAATMCGRYTSQSIPRTPALRISYFFNSRGASVGVETACSSSLVALHLARQSILVGESQLAIVCGANHVAARSFNALYQSHMVSPDGRSAAFDRSANGFVRAESFTVCCFCPRRNILSRWPSFVRNPLPRSTIFESVARSWARPSTMTGARPPSSPRTPLLNMK